MSKAKMFSCIHCGTPFPAYPPDDEHPVASLEKPQEAAGSIVEMTHDCQNRQCGKPATLYWFRRKTSFTTG
jgi:hypothetical protein